MTKKEKKFGENNDNQVRIQELKKNKAILRWGRIFLQ
jgi:hypothetical protein